MIKLLIVDDSALMRRLLRDLFRAHGDFEVAYARDGEEALERLAAFRPHVVTLDINMPRRDGLSCLDRIMVEQPCPVVMVSSLTEAGAEATLDALALGAVDYVAKPAGAVSLALDEWGPVLVAKVRAAAGARIRPALRLTERVRERAARARAVARPTRPVTAPKRTLGGEGIVLVGASTGGPPALDALLGPLPADFPWPILVAQHMPAAFTGSLSQRLDRLCALPVAEVTRAMPLEGGRVYIGRGDADMIVSHRLGGTIVLAVPASSDHRWHPSVDRLVSSALEHLHAVCLIGILMTGMGNDGAAAMTRLRAEGGRTIAEAEETAVVWGMPGELVKAGGAEIVLPLPSIAAQLMDWVA